VNLSNHGFAVTKYEQNNQLNPISIQGFVVPLLLWVHFSFVMDLNNWNSSVLATQKVKQSYNSVFLLCFEGVRF